MRSKRRQTSTSPSEIVPVKQVFLFVRRVFLKIIPCDIFGNIRNQNEFLKYIEKLFSIPVHGKMSVLFMMSKMRTQFMAWLKPFSQKEQGLKLQDLIKFLVLSLIGPLIQSFFYVTEANHSNELMFYRKKIWHRLLQKAYNKFRTQCKLKFVSEEWVENERKKGKCLGISYPHFLPKKHSLRPVVNCAKRKHGRASLNDHLKSLHLILSYVQETEPSQFGVSIIGMDEFHQRWKSYYVNMQNKCVRRYYFVKADLLNCFDKIDTVLLFGIVKQLLENSYTVYKYKKTTFIKGKYKTVFYESLKAPGIICKETPKAIDCISSVEIKRDILLEKLHALLFCNVVKLGRQLFIQTVGIPQGACVSSLLCAAYFGHMDKTVCASFLGSHNLLVRMTDDMLFVTPHKDTAKRFLELMLDGVAAMNCTVNFRKCYVNFSHCHPVLGKVQSIHDGEQMRYCGICINPKTLEICLDHSNLEGKDRSLVSWELTHNVGTILRNKIWNSLNQKCLSILFDADINSKQQIRDNIVYIFAVCSVKFHHLVMKLPAKQRVLNNPAFFTRIIQSLPNRLYTLAFRALKKFSNINKKEWSFPVSKATVRCLCNTTFLYKLQRHHGTYAPVIDSLFRLEKKTHLNSEICKQLTNVFENIFLRY